MKNFISVTPSFLVKLAQEARGKSVKECLELCEKVAKLNDSILDANSFGKITEEEDIKIPNDLPEDIEEIATGIIGALEQKD